MNEQTLLPPESPYQKMAGEFASLLLTNSLTTVRQSIGVRAGLTHDGARDIYTACGYPVALSVVDYYGRWRRGDVARRVIEAYPKACWQEHPEVWDNKGQEAVTESEPALDVDPTLAPVGPVPEEADVVPKTNAFPMKQGGKNPVQPPFNPEPGVNTPPLPRPKKPVVRGKGKEKAKDTPFMKEFKSLAKRTKLFHYMQRVDVLAGIGRYGVLYLGFDDTTDVQQEVASGAKLLYVQAFREDCASISTLEGEVTNPRYGLPKAYNLRTAQGLNDPNTVRGAYPLTTDSAAGQLGLTLSNVHWSRCIHVVDEPDDGELYGTPRLEAVWNRLQDIETAVSASGETFWRTGFQRVFASINPGEGVVMTTKSRKNLEDKIQEMMMGLKDHIVGQGIDMKTLAGQTADPTQIVDTCLKLIGATKSIPYRVLAGTEEAQLAGDQDKGEWKGNVNCRRNGYCVNTILRPVVDRLIKYQSITAPANGEYDAEWKSAEEQAPDVRAQVMTATVSAITGYLSGGGDQLVPRKAFLTDMMDVDPDVAEQYLDEADAAVAQAEIESQAQMEMAMEQMPFEQGGGMPPGQPGKAPPFGGKSPSPCPPQKQPFPQQTNMEGLQGQGDTPWWRKISEFLGKINPLKRNVEDADLPDGTPVVVDLEGGVKVNANISGRNEAGELTATGDDGSVYTLPE